jgi:peptidoglycan/LPS O-acetylase OafA/YrhL
MHGDFGERVRSDMWGLGDVRVNAEPVKKLGYNAVIFGHAGIPVKGGYHGVTAFFVLSGYLITSLLVREIDISGRINVRHFYLRRFARLGPAMALVVTVTLIWLLIIGAPFRDYFGGLVGTVTYTTDLILALGGGQTVGDYFTWSWSLGVEEQFYLIWPFVLLLLLRVRRVWVIGVTLLVAVLGLWSFKAVLGADPGSHERMFYSPDIHADALLLGTAIALVQYFYGSSRQLRRFAAIVGPLGLVGLVVMICIAAGGLPALAMFDAGGFSQTAVFASAVVLWLVYKPTSVVGRALGWAPLAYLGKLSYGLYLWNVLATLIYEHFTDALPFDSWWGIPWVCALVLVAYASYRFIETPLRRKWSPVATYARKPDAIVQTHSAR